MISFRRKVYCTLPKPVDFVIIDRANSSRSRSILPAGSSIAIIDVRPVHWNIHPRVLLKTFICVSQIKLRLSRQYSPSFVKGILKQIECAHIKAILTLIKPKAVVTGIDNSEKWSWLSDNCSDMPFFAIQNGFRLSYDSNSNLAYSSQHYFCFGERERIDLPKIGYRINNFYPVGSLLASRHFKKIATDEILHYDILIVSCWRGRIGFRKDVRESMKSMELMDKALFKYLKNRDLKVAVILRSERQSDDWVMPDIGCSEEDYFKSIYGGTIKLIDNNVSERNVYSEMLKAKVLLASFPTTCLFEAFGWGKKVLYANFCRNKTYFSDVSDKILFNSSDKNDKVFYDMLDKLLTTETEDYIAKHQELMNYYMTFSDILSTEDLIRKKICELL